MMVAERKQSAEGENIRMRSPSCGASIVLAAAKADVGGVAGRNEREGEEDDGGGGVPPL